jgi:hypothetical protein
MTAQLQQGKPVSEMTTKELRLELDARLKELLMKR